MVAAAKQSLAPFDRSISKIGSAPATSKSGPVVESAATDITKASEKVVPKPVSVSVTSASDMANNMKKIHAV